MLRHRRYLRKGYPSAKSQPALQASLLSDDPFISYSGMSGTPLGLASHMPLLPRSHRAWFLISPTWSIENNSSVKTIRTYAVLHRLRNPRHSLIFLCNTQAEADLLNQSGEAAVLHNKTSTTSEYIFRPLKNVPVEFDAIYNAQLASWKRHDLSLGIERCAFVFYRDLVGSSTTESERARINRHKEFAPGHVFINEFDSTGKPVRLAPAHVNMHLNRAAVGICLSEMEGPMFASTEYLLAGLPVVTTPNHGGRDLYLDDDYSLTVPPDPRSIAEAVLALKERRIPRAYIRSQTLKRVERDRGRFIDLVNEIFLESGSLRRIAMPWPFRFPVMEWLPPHIAIDRSLSGTVDALASDCRRDCSPFQRVESTRR
ncbi:glycosyltransferase family 4 protein [Mesorhizobium sp. B3-1-7]|uniref:glycosyltransferase n=1 Tax=Mesorhizobium sp. B3-1-7 TaxID=2589894 RepID=UPI00112EB839|nr:glycosyltransferase family 4 protein [Mesorhizobium sp. B3-1-7]TPI62433.1 glycosyltransferase family 4 protein [Mesorhizobium sp. B3-1-7]